MAFPSLRPGLVSISFRNLSPEDLVQHSAQNGLKGIEWGGDVHVPHGDRAQALRVASLTADEGLEVAAYGSYYRLGLTQDNPDFEEVLESAVALGAPTIRVWAGRKASAVATEGDRKQVTEDAFRICAKAEEAGLRVCLEYHRGTLTDSLDSAQRLLSDLPIPNLDTLWQPPNGQTDDHCEATLLSVRPRISNLHVFHWGPGGWKDRHPLQEGMERWKRFFQLATEEPKPRWALLEFVKGDRPEQLKADATVLNSLITGRDVSAT